MQNHRPNQDSTNDRQPSMQAFHVDEESSQEYWTGEYDWLSGQWNKTPLLLYKYWLVLNFLIALMLECGAMVLVWDSSQEDRYSMFQLAPMSLNITLMLVLYGCAEMLFAINRKKSSAAERSVLKFQSSLFGSIVCLVCQMKRNYIFGGFSSWIVLPYLTLPPIIHLVGGFAVLKAFKKNHPLVRGQTSEDSTQEFFEQNQIIASELLRYEELLNSWPYVVYNFWLKLTTASEILVIFSWILSKAVKDLRNWMYQKQLSAAFFFEIGALILSCFNAYSRFEMEVAIRTRASKESKRAVRLLKISIVSSILSNLFVTMTVDPDRFEYLTVLVPASSRETWLVFFFLTPIICLLGAIKVNRVIGERDSFAKVSSYNSEAYL